MPHLSTTARLPEHRRLPWAECGLPWRLPLLSALREGPDPILSGGRLWPLAPLLANVIPVSLQSGFLGPDPHFVLLIVALNLFSL